MNRRGCAGLGITACLEPLHRCLRTRRMPLSPACATVAMLASRQDTAKYNELCLFHSKALFVVTRQDPVGHLPPTVSLVICFELQLL